jgi:hypothetical protein
MGLVRGKAAGLVFLDLPMVKVTNGYGVFEVPLPPINYRSRLLVIFCMLYFSSKPFINRVQTNIEKIQK